MSGTQPYYIFRCSCELIGRARSAGTLCHTQTLVHNSDFPRTSSMNLTIPQSPLDPHSDANTYLTPEISMKQFTLHNAKSFTVDIGEETSDREIELAFILSIMMDDNKEDFYNSN